MSKTAPSTRSTSRTIRLAAFALAATLLSCSLLSACAATGDGESNTTSAQGSAGDRPASSASTSQSGESPSSSSPSSESASQGKSSGAGEGQAAFDPYASDNVYDIDGSLLERHDGIDYGSLLTDVEYYSSTAGDAKRCNILLPAGYDEAQRYPVMYVIHGFSGTYYDLLNDNAFLVTLYGNMLARGLAKPQIIVSVDMYTATNAEKPYKSDEELRFIYDKVVDDIAVDLMPFMKSNYPVDDRREATAVAGFSQGGAESLCTGFKWLDKFGYIAAFAPDTGVIPTEYFVGTFWNVPYFQQFPQPGPGNTPLYLYLNVGTEDPWNVDCTLYYGEVLNGMGVRNQTDLVPGRGHDDGLWQPSFYNFLAKTFR